MQVTLLRLLQSTAAETAGSLGLPKAGRVVSLCLAVLYVVTMAAQAPTIDTSRIGPPVGQKVPDFSGIDQLGRKYTLASSLGPKGAMVVFFRSADW